MRIILVFLVLIFLTETHGSIKLEVSSERSLTLFFEKNDSNITFDFSRTEYERAVDIHSETLAQTSVKNYI